MILAIETSCDDSAVALLDMKGGIITNEISSQIDLHKKYGGIVPEIASRKHLTTLPLILRHIFKEHAVNLSDLKAIAVTYSPGLIGSLLVGVNYAKTLSWIAGCPLFPVDHLEGHLLAPFLDEKDLSFPYLALIASGGHTHIIHAKAIGDYQLLGKTMDDAAGEAYDKVAKMLGFQYPGGPIIEKIAESYADPDIQFPIPLKGKKTFDFSFSGLKTAVRNESIKRDVYTEAEQLISYAEFGQIKDLRRKDEIGNIAASFQSIMCQIFERRMKEAIKLTQCKKMAISGGVAANKGIQRTLKQLAKKRGIDFYYPSIKNCTDNAAMIAYTALQYYNSGKSGIDKALSLNASSKSPLGQMQVSV